MGKKNTTSKKNLLFFKFQGGWKSFHTPLTICISFLNFFYLKPILVYAQTSVSPRITTKRFREQVMSALVFILPKNVISFLLCTRFGVVGSKLQRNIMQSSCSGRYWKLPKRDRCAHITQGNRGCGWRLRWPEDGTGQSSGSKLKCWCCHFSSLGG